jgi:uncharacterized surface protein with fasciclin (FAS1) repeats
MTSPRVFAGIIVALLVSAAALTALALQPKAGHEGHNHNHDGPKDLNGLLESTVEFSTLAGLIKQADLVDVIEDSGPYTIFAPTNAAFDKLPEATLDALTKPENKEQLKKLLLHHLVKGKLTSKDLKPGEIKTAADTKLTLAVADGKLTISKAGVTKADIQAADGVIHAIDTVLQP